MAQPTDPAPRAGDPLIPDGRVRLAVYALLFAAALLPLMLAEVPPLVDYPNHLARLHVIANIDADPAIAQNYTVSWGIMPNLALEAVTWPLLVHLSAETLGRLFIALTFALLFGGTLWLHRLLHGGLGLWPMAALLFLYNHLLVMGFLSYLFTLGAALVFFAAWIASADWPRWTRLTLFPAAVLALFFGHLFALAVYGVCVAAYEIDAAWRGRRDQSHFAPTRLFYASLQFLPALLLLLSTAPEAAERTFMYGTLANKVRAIWSPTLTYQKPIDLGLMLFASGILLAGLIRRKLFLAPALRGPLLVLAPIAIAMPFWIHGAWGSIFYADLRLPLVIALLLVAGLKVRDVSSRTCVTVASMALVMFGARIVDVTQEWRRADREFAEFRNAVAVIPRGAALLPVQKRNAHFETGVSRFEYAYWQMSALAVIERAAFIPFLFTDPKKQPVAAAPARKAIDTPFGAPIDYEQLAEGVEGGGEGRAALPERTEKERFWTNWPQKYDYVLVSHFGAKGNPLPGLLEPLHEGSIFTIYRVVRTAVPEMQPANPIMPNGGNG